MRAVNAFDNIVLRCWCWVYIIVRDVRQRVQCVSFGLCVSCGHLWASYPGVVASQAVATEGHQFFCMGGLRAWVRNHLGCIGNVKWL